MQRNRAEIVRAWVRASRRARRRRTRQLRRAHADRVRRVGALLGNADDCVKAVAALRARVGINGGLAGSGIREEHLPLLAKKALEDACHRCSPRPCTEADLLELYRASL